VGLALFLLPRAAQASEKKPFLVTGFHFREFDFGVLDRVGVDLVAVYEVFLEG
jgi:hypothetical protein